jgi:hypothetical protein
MPANGRWDLIRRLKVNIAGSNKKFFGSHNKQVTYITAQFQPNLNHTDRFS